MERIKDGLPEARGIRGHRRRTIGGLSKAVLYRYRAGIPWRDLPERFGAWKAVHTRFRRWAASGVWESLFKRLAGDADNEYAMIDSTIVRPISTAAGARKNGQEEAIGRSKGGLSTKIHALVDALGNPLAFC